MDAYKSRGVSADKEEVKAAIARQDKGLYPGAFCKLLPDPAGDPAYCSALHADGAGTKSITAYLAYREGAGPEVFAGLAQDSTVMNTDDLMCIGAVGPFLLSNTIGRNAQRIPGAVLQAVIEGYADFARCMAAEGVTIELCGGETADVGDLVQTIICDSTAFVRLPKAEVLDLAKLRPGLAIVGLSSTGQATYEQRENSGIASNGLTLARHVLLHPDYRTRYPEAWSPTMDPSKAYCGHYHLDDRLPGSTLTVAEALLSPTRSYLPIVRLMLERYREGLYGLIHCTGGALSKSLNFGQGIRYVKNNLFPRPAIFEAIQRSAEVSEAEMYKSFNLGQRLEIYCEPELVQPLIALAASFNVEARQIGHTEASGQAGNEVVIEDRNGTYVYR